MAIASKTPSEFDPNVVVIRGRYPLYCFIIVLLMQVNYGKKNHDDDEGKTNDWARETNVSVVDSMLDGMSDKYLCGFHMVMS